MELFNEYRNKSVNAFIELAERISNGEIMSESEFEMEYYRLSGDEKRITSVFYDNMIYNDKLPVFDFRNPKQVSLMENMKVKENVHISCTPLETEKSWLHTALNDKLCRLFLTEEEKQAVDSDLSDYPFYYRNIDDTWRKDEEITDDTVCNFKTILDAVNQKKSISYSYKNKKSEGTPVKIEYDERTCKIYVIIYNGERFIKSEIAKLSDIQITDSLYENIPQIKEEMAVKKSRTPVVFTVTDYKNRKAIDRALLAFSVYDHIVEPIDEKTAKFTIRYYTMDLDILVKDILAFGSDIKVESPRHVVNKIIKILKKV